MKKLVPITLFLVLIIFIIGCKSQSGTVEIKNVQYKDGNILLTLNSNQSLSNVSIKISSDGKTLCEKHKDLDSGTNHFEFADCELENQIKVSVFPPQGISSEKDFNLGLPILKLEEGYKYDYSVITCGTCLPQDISIYVSEETQDEWKGIAGMKKSDQRAYLLRYKINKNDLRLLATEPFSEDQIKQANVEYRIITDLNSDVTHPLYPFFLLMFKEQGINLDELIQNKNTTFAQQGLNLEIVDTEIKDGFLSYKIIVSQMQSGQTLSTVYISTQKPYLALSIEDGVLSFKNKEKKDFSINDYSGYTFEEKQLLTQKPEMQNP